MKLREMRLKSAIRNAEAVINNGDATAKQISDEKSKVEQALTHLNDAKQQLTADTTELQTAVQQLNRRGDTNNKSQEVSMNIIKQFNH